MVKLQDYDDSSSSNNNANHDTSHNNTNNNFIHNNNNQLNKNSTFDQSSPYYLHPTETHGEVLVTHPICKNDCEAKSMLSVS